MSERIITNLNERLRSLPVLTSDGREVPLTSLWSARPAVLVLIRHFG